MATNGKPSLTNRARIDPRPLSAGSLLPAPSRSPPASGAIRSVLEADTDIQALSRVFVHAPHALSPLIGRHRRFNEREHTLDPHQRPTSRRTTHPTTYIPAANPWP